MKSECVKRHVKCIKRYDEINRRKQGHPWQIKTHIRMIPSQF